jgi:DNA-binding YbaB/EbfC family protein
MDIGKIKEMMGQAQQMQQQLEAAMLQIRVEGSSGGGAITVSMDGKKRVLGVHIDPSAAALGAGATEHSADVEMLQDLIAAAVNDAIRRVDEALKGKLSGMMGGADWLRMLNQ